MPPQIREVDATPGLPLLKRRRKQDGNQLATDSPSAGSAAVPEGTDPVFRQPTSEETAVDEAYWMHLQLSKTSNVMHQQRKLQPRTECFL